MSNELRCMDSLCRRIIRTKLREMRLIILITSKFRRGRMLNVSFKSSRRRNKMISRMHLHWINRWRSGVFSQQSRNKLIRCTLIMLRVRCRDKSSWSWRRRGVLSRYSSSIICNLRGRLSRCNRRRSIKVLWVNMRGRLTIYRYKLMSSMIQLLQLGL